MNVPNRFVEIGCDLADSMYLDFHSKDSALPDYSARIISQGGATTGTGNLNMYASTIGLMVAAGVGIGTTAPNAALHIKNATTAMRITGNLTNASTRPAATTTPGAFEIRGSGSTDGNDDGFLRLSAGGGNAAYLQSYIDLTGYSTMADMDRNIIFGVAGAERMRINIYGFVGIGTTSPQMPLQLGAGFTTDLGTGLKTQYNQVTSITAASVRNGSDWASGGTYGGTGPYTWTTNVASGGSYFTIATGITPGATYQVSITASGPAGSSFSFGYSSSITLTTSLTTYTGIAANLTSSGLYVFIFGPSGTVFTFSNITFQRLDTLATGYVGIGTTVPSAQLQISNANMGRLTSIYVGPSTQSGIVLDSTSGASGKSFNIWSTGSGDSTGAGSLAFFDITASAYRMVISSTGNVGIGITNPTIPLHVNGYTGSVAGAVYYINGANGYTIQYGSLTNISIFASNGIQAGDYIGARSDQRIKKNIQPLTSPLEKLSQIEVVSYDKIDFTAKGSDCGVIAQNIKEILPRAVTTMTDYLPNIYAIGTHNKDDDTVRVTVVFTENTIKVNVKVKLYVVRDEANNEVQTPYEVVVIDYDDVSITVAPWDKYDASDRVFVYGVEHDDIMSVEKDQIGILAAAGVKELHPLVLQQSSRIGDLETQLTAENTQLKSQLASLEARLAAAGL